MPSFEKHVAQAAHNRSLASFLDKEQKDNYNDWVVTVCFYTVLHLVEAMIHECDHLRAPSNAYPRFSENKTLVKISNVKHSADLEPNYGRKGHELRDCVIEDNRWYFKRVGDVSLALRSMSQSARYDCQAMVREDADFALSKTFEAVTDFNAWALPKKLATV